MQLESYSLAGDEKWNNDAISTAMDVLYSEGC